MAIKGTGYCVNQIFREEWFVNTDFPDYFSKLAMVNQYILRPIDQSYIDFNFCSINIFRSARNCLGKLMM